MRLTFKQRFLTWFDSYDIYNEHGGVEYVVKGQLSWGHCFKVFDKNGAEVGMVKQRVLTFLPKFDISVGGRDAGTISKEFSLFKPCYNIDYNGWHIEGSFWEWDYTIQDNAGRQVAVISKELFHWTDTYIIDVADDNNALMALLFVLAIDAEKCSRSNS